MSLKQLRMHLMMNDVQQKGLMEALAAPDTTPDWVKATLDAKNKQYQKEAARAERKAAKAARNAKT